MWLWMTGGMDLLYKSGISVFLFYIYNVITIVKIALSGNRLELIKEPLIKSTIF